MIRKFITQHKVILIISTLILASCLALPRNWSEEKRSCPTLGFCKYYNVEVEVKNYGAPSAYLFYEKIKYDNLVEKSNLRFDSAAAVVSLSTWLSLSLTLLVFNIVRIKSRAHTRY